MQFKSLIKAIDQNKQFYKDGKDYGWLGSAIDVHSPTSGRFVVRNLVYTGNEYFT